ncbi:MAG TPA: serine hydrolase domain-containing protein [Saprospiraceae bacterium]|nr:serine hydrolase domain-containing protein [Saprospiraceae bacterium]HMQ83155.1 serine hydrolase domain-containing protein [Saprospiraceae bacterium]
MSKPPFHLILIALLLAQTAACQNATPLLTPDQLGSRFVEAINAEDAALQEAIATEVYSEATIQSIGIQRITAHFQELHRRYAPLDYHHSDRLEYKKPTGTSYVLHIYARKKGEVMYSDFQFYLESTPPHRIDKLVFVAEVAEPISLPNGSIEQQQTLDWLDGYIQKLELENDLSGSILIAKGDQVLFEKYWGFADIENTQKINAESLFGLASGSKMFTAVAIVQLMEQGKLKLTDKLTDYFPDFPNHAWADRVTLKHLLSHTSGIAEYWTSENQPAMLRFEHWHEYLPLIYKEGFQFEPGTESGYSNSNFMLLGFIVERASGQDYFQYIEDNILKKAGMVRSGYFDHNDKNLPLVVPYARQEGGGWVNNRSKQFRKGSPAGGCYSNATDMLLFCKALKNNQLVSSESLMLMTTDWTVGTKDAQPYGLGLILEQYAMEPTYGHGGTAGGVNFEFRYFPRMDIALLVFNNQNNGAYDDLKRNTLKLISGAR